MYRVPDDSCGAWSRNAYKKANRLCGHYYLQYVSKDRGSWLVFVALVNDTISDASLPLDPSHQPAFADRLPLSDLPGGGLCISIGLCVKAATSGA